MDINVFENDKLFFHMHTIKFDKNTFSKQTFLFRKLRIIRILSGNLIWLIRNRKYNVVTDDIIVFNNMEFRKILSVDNETDVEMEVYEFLPTAVGNSYACLDVFFKRDIDFSNVFTAGSDGHESAMEYLNYIRGEILTDNHNKIAMIRGLLINFLVILSRHMPVLTELNREIDMSATNVGILSDITAHIHNNLKSKLNVEILSKNANMSKEYFSKIFKLYNGMPPSEYIRAIRINFAIQLMYNSECSVTDAAYESGFGSISSFYNAFEKIIGLPPKLYMETIMRHKSASEN